MTDKDILKQLPAIIEAGGDPNPCGAGRYCVRCLCAVAATKLGNRGRYDDALIQARNIIVLFADMERPTKEQALKAARAALEFVS